MLLRGRLAAACLVLASLLCLLGAWCCCHCSVSVPAAQHTTAQRPQRTRQGLAAAAPVDATAPGGARTVQNRWKSMWRCAAVMRSMPQGQWGAVSSGAARADNGCDGGICLNFQLKHDANARLKTWGGLTFKGAKQAGSQSPAAVMLLWWGSVGLHVHRVVKRPAAPFGGGRTPPARQKPILPATSLGHKP